MPRIPTSEERAIAPHIVRSRTTDAIENTIASLCSDGWTLEDCNNEDIDIILPCCDD